MSKLDNSRWVCWGWGKMGDQLTSSLERKIVLHLKTSFWWWSWGWSGAYKEACWVTFEAQQNSQCLELITALKMYLFPQRLLRLLWILGLRSFSLKCQRSINRLIDGAAMQVFKPETPKELLAHVLHCLGFLIEKYLTSLNEGDSYKQRTCRKPGRKRILKWRSWQLSIVQWYSPCDQAFIAELALLNC